MQDFSNFRRRFYQREKETGREETLRLPDNLLKVILF